jgi:hypothetical protein
MLLFRQLVSSSRSPVVEEDVLRVGTAMIRRRSDVVVATQMDVAD